MLKNETEIFYFIICLLFFIHFLHKVDKRGTNVDFCCYCSRWKFSITYLWHISSANEIVFLSHSSFVISSYWWNFFSFVSVQTKNEIVRNHRWDTRMHGERVVRKCRCWCYFRKTKKKLLACWRMRQRPSWFLTCFILIIWRTPKGMWKTEMNDGSILFSGIAWLWHKLKPTYFLFSIEEEVYEIISFRSREYSNTNFATKNFHHIINYFNVT